MACGLPRPAPVPETNRPVLSAQISVCARLRYRLYARVGPPPSESARAANEPPAVPTFRYRLYAAPLVQRTSMLDVPATLAEPSKPGNVMSVASTKQFALTVADTTKVSVFVAACAPPASASRMPAERPVRILIVRIGFLRVVSSGVHTRGIVLRCP